MVAYYNEFDKNAAAWLRELIKAGVIAPGDVDERSIEDVRPSELMGYTQCHFFAGIGGWSYALRLAGWPDDRPVWTGSCPCQPFSAAGKQAGTKDDRHLWPEFFRLIRECQPDTVFGEQVAAAIGLDWLDHVQDDLEGIGYAAGAIVLPACSVGAPHIRQRLWFVAESDSGMLGQGRGPRPGETNGGGTYGGLAGSSAPGKLVQSGCPGLEGYAGQGDDRHEPGRLATQPGGPVTTAGATRSVEHVESEQMGVSGCSRERRETAGFWHPADWLPCHDGKARPVEPGTFPLAHGVPARVGRLRGYGNAIVPQVAAEFIKAYEITCLL